MKKMFKITWVGILAMLLCASLVYSYPVQPDDMAPVSMSGVPADISVTIVADASDVPADIVPGPLPMPDVISTSELKVLVDTPTPEELPGLVKELTQLVKQKSWPAAIALAIVILMGVLKLDFVGNLLVKYVPKRIMPLIPIGLGVIAGAIQGFISGGWQQAAQVVVESGVLAIVFHQIWSHTVKGKDSTANG